MLKEVKTIPLIFISIVLISTFALAAGDSTIAQDGSDSTQGNEPAIRTGTENSASINCDAPALTRRERIKCRLKKGEEKDSEETDGANTIPEACRRLATASDGKKISKDRCRNFYNKISPCYKLSGIQKTACFRRTAGLKTDRKISRDDDSTKIREYLVALLYELQEKIEHAVENDSQNLDEETAANIIDLIVEIKEKLMNNEPKSEIRPMLQELRTQIREIRGKVNE